MSGENATLSYGSQISNFDVRPIRLLCFLLQEPNSEQARVAFIHVKAFDCVVPKGAQHLETTDTKNDFLAQAIICVSPVKAAG